MAVKGTLHAQEQERRADRRELLRRRSTRRRDPEAARARRRGAADRMDARARLPRLRPRARRSRPGATMTVDFELELATRGASATRTRATAIVDNGTFFNSRAASRTSATRRRGELADSDARRSTASRRASACPTSTTRRRRSDNYISNDADWIDFDATVSTSAGPDRDRARLPRSGSGPRTAGATSTTRWTRRSSTSTPYPLGALRGEARPRGSGRAPSRSTTTPATSTTSTAMIDGDEGLARLLHEELQPLPAPAGAHPRVPALRRVRPVVPQHDPVLGERSASSPRSTRRIPRTIDYPYYVTAHEVAHQWWAHQVIGGERAGRDDAVGDARAVLGADGDEAEVRRRRR